MKLWKRGIAMALAAVMLLALLTACGGSSGPAASEQPGSSGSSGTGGTEQPGTGEAGGGSGGETGGTGESGGSGSGETGGSGTEEPGKGDKEDENDPKTEEQKAIEATVKALNTVRAEYGCKPLTPDEQACAYAKEMAQVQLDGVNGVYGSDPMKSEKYQAAWNEVSKKTVNKKSVIGVGGYGAYPTEAVFRDWAGSASKWKASLVLSSEATLVGVGVVKNTNEKTKKDWPYMVVVMTY